MLLRNQLGSLLDQVQDNFHRHGRLAAVFMLNLKGSQKLMPAPMRLVADKETQAAFIKYLIRDEGLLEIVLIHEAWFGKGGVVLQHYRKHGTLAKYPQRREALSVFYASPTEEIAHLAEIFRRPGEKKASLGSWERMVVVSEGRSKDVELQARFCGLWKQVVSEKEKQ